MRDFSHGEKKLALLEKLLYVFRVSRITKYLSQAKTVVDLGCGYNACFLMRLQKLNKFDSLVGVDISINKNLCNDVVILKFADLNNVLPLYDQSTDAVTSLAVIEHLTNPQEHLNEVFRILKDGGKFILTTPAPIAKPVLEFLSYKLHLVDKVEIDDHKQYLSLKALKIMLLNSGFEESKIRLSSFLFGFNNFVICTK